MASTEHCLMCFEALEAELAHRKPMTLEAVQASWAEFKAASSPSLKDKDPILRRLAAETPSSSTPVSSSSSSSNSTSAAASTPATSATSLASSASSAPSAAPLFVTWNTVDDPSAADPGDTEVSLRGCIGTFESQPLSASLPEYAVISAIHDTRFPPISARELPALQASVTLLTDFEEVDDAYDWEVGVHGVRLSFRDARGRRYGSTYLPDVASEQGWTREEALYSLVRKAGWAGSRSKFSELDLKVTRYQGKRFAINYPEYKAWKEWRESTN